MNERKYVCVHGERHIRREVAEAHGITPTTRVEPELMRQVIAESLDLDRPYVRERS
jgi:hypothetical protein